MSRIARIHQALTEEHELSRDAQSVYIALQGMWQTQPDEQWVEHADILLYGVQVIGTEDQILNALTELLAAGLVTDDNGCGPVAEAFAPHPSRPDLIWRRGG